MAKKKSGGGVYVATGKAGGEQYNMKESCRVEDIITAAHGLAKGKDYSRGYPSTMNKEMHINRGASARTKRGGAD